MEKKNYSDFIPENAFSAAESLAGDDSHLTLVESRWKAFCAALDVSPRNVLALRKLLTEPDAFEG